MKKIINRRLKYNMFTLYIQEHHVNNLDKFVSERSQKEREQIEEVKVNGGFDGKMATALIKHCFNITKIEQKDKVHRELVYFLENSLDCLIQIYTQCENAYQMGIITSDLPLQGRHSGLIGNSIFSDEFDYSLKSILTDILKQNQTVINQADEKKLIRSMVKNVKAKYKELAQKSGGRKLKTL